MLAGTAVIVLREGVGLRSAVQLGWIAVGTLLVALPIGAYYLAVGALGDLFLAVFWTSFGQYLQGGEFNLPMPALEWLPAEWSRRGLRRWFMSWEFRVPVLLYAGRSSSSPAPSGAAAGRSRRAPIARRSSSGSRSRSSGPVLYLRATGRSDYYHLAPILFPAYILGADWIARGWRRLALPRGRALAYPLVVLVLAASLELHEFDRAVRRGLDRAGKLEIMPGGPLVERAQALDDLVADVRTRTRPGEPIVVLPWYPILYFLTERPNPTRFDWLFPGYLTTEAEVARFIDEIDRSPAQVVVYSPISIDGLPDRSLAAFAPEIDRFLLQRFAPTKRFGRFWVLTRKEPPTGVRREAKGEP